MKTIKLLSAVLTLAILIGTFAAPAMAEPAPTTKPARNPAYGLLYGYGDDGVAELQYNARYTFEQSVLPIIMYQYEKETIDYVNDATAAEAEEYILSLWEYAAAEALLTDAEQSGENPDASDAEEFWARADERRPLYGLGDEHIIDVTIEEIDADTSAILVTMLDTEWALLSTYIGVAYNETEGLRIFTLERSFGLLDDGTAPYMFCYVETESRGNYGQIENDRQAFIDAIKDAMSGSSAPS